MPKDASAFEFGYDPTNPPEREYFMLACETDKGKVDHATVTLGNIERQFPRLQAEVTEMRRRYKAMVDELDKKSEKVKLEDAIMLVAKEKTAEVKELYDRAVDEMRDLQKRWAECREVIETAVEKRYLIRVEDMTALAESNIHIPVHTLCSKVAKSAPPFEAVLAAS